MRLFVWYLGRTLQFIALLQVGAALLIGMQTTDVRLELSLLLFGIIEFLLGRLLQNRSSSS